VPCTPEPNILEQPRKFQPAQLGNWDPWVYHLLPSQGMQMWQSEQTQSTRSEILTVLCLSPFSDIGMLLSAHLHNTYFHKHFNTENPPYFPFPTILSLPCSPRQRNKHVLQRRLANSDIFHIHVPPPQRTQQVLFPPFGSAQGRLSSFRYCPQMIARQPHT
jgi:hypothetical protein